MHDVLVYCLFKLAQEKVWLGELTIAVDLGRKATKQTNKYLITSFRIHVHIWLFGPLLQTNHGILRGKGYKMARLRSACASTKTDQSLRWTHNGDSRAQRDIRWKTKSGNQN